MNKFVETKRRKERKGEKMSSFANCVRIESNYLFISTVIRKPAEKKKSKIVNARKPKGKVIKDFSFTRKEGLQGPFLKKKK